VTSIVNLVLSDKEIRAAGKNKSSQRCKRHKDLLHLDIASFFKALFSAIRTGYIRYALAGPVKFSNFKITNRPGASAPAPQIV
jgi:hypothetical protein